MSKTQEKHIRVRIDSTNPGQFFACCGLLELADRLWGGAEAWFEPGAFITRPLADKNASPTDLCLGDLLNAIASASLHQVDPDDDTASPIILGTPFNLRLDWWADERAGGKRLKVWAGSMRCARIARAMQAVLQRPELQDEAMLDHAVIVYDTLVAEKKVEPFYFDARRGSNALSLDVGFSTDKLNLKTAAYPAVEFLCLVGLQRHRPMATTAPRVFEYYTWSVPMEARLAPSAVCGLLAQFGKRGFRFENAFRSDQRKHKAFTPATPFERS
ncbi:MAG TPA: hypothetical protein VM425_03760 [Myxococcota bacterium]|nr:hypothetical protein [Myxococcota bacterium]